MVGCGGYVGSATRNFVIGVPPTVDVPTIPAKAYTGTAQTADVPESILYDVTYNEPHTDVGEYEVELTLTDPANYSWSETSDDWVVVPFWIVQATNSWTTTPSITGWTYGETAHVPVAGAKFGNVKVTYDGTAADGSEISGATSVTKAGDYEAVFTVAGNRNYTGLTNRVPFSVAKAGVPGSGDDGGDISVNVSGYEGLYDGQGHSITVALSGSDAPSFTVTYALNGDGPFSAAKPMFTNVCSETVWYVLSSPNYATVTNSAAVTITKRTVTLTSADATKPYDGTALVKNEVSVGGDGFVTGEGVGYAFTGSQTTVGSSTNAFTYTLNDGTLAGNYEISTVNGTLTVTEAYKPLVIRCEWEDGTLKPDSMYFTILTNDATWQAVSVSAAEDWRKSLDVKVYADGEPINYALSVVPVNSVRSQVEALGCRTLGSLRMADRILAESGWQNVGSATLQSVVATVDGWQRLGSIPMNVLVIAEDSLRGVFFKVENFRAAFDVDDGTGGAGGEASRFSYSGVYDGMGHGIDVVITNAPAEMSIKYARGDASTPPVEGWSPVNPLFTNVCDKAVVWYVVECTGYVSYTNNATVTITKRTVTLTSGSASKVYDGSPVRCSDINVTGDGFVMGEGASYNITGLQTVPGSSQNAFSYTLNDGTNESNYNITCIYGTLSITVDENVVKWALGCGDTPVDIDIESYTGSISTELSHDGIASYVDGWNAGGRDGTVVSRDILSVKIIGPKRISFWWCAFVTCQACWGSLFVDGEEKRVIEEWGENTSECVEINIGPGEHTIIWQLRVMSLGPFSVGGVPVEVGGDPVEYDYNNYLFIDELKVEDMTLDIDDGTEGGTGGEASRFSYSGVYDGMGHGIDVVITNAPAEISIKYARGDASAPPVEGWSPVNPLFTNVCDKAVVWYVVECTGYVPYTNNATVTITKATYDMSGAQWDYAGEFPYDGNAKTVEVSGLPDGIAVASYTDNTKTLPGTYTAHVAFSYDATNYNEPTLADLTWVIKSPEETVLHEIFDDLPVVIGPDGDGGWTVTLTNDITGPLDIPDNLGHLTIDLNGYDLIGPDGISGSETAPGGNGQQAIRIVAGEGDGNVTRLSIVTTGGDSLVKGGDGGDGNPSVQA